MKINNDIYLYNEVASYPRVPSILRSVYLYKISVLLKLGANPNVLTNFYPLSYTCLSIATKDKNIHLVNLLLDYGADPNQMFLDYEYFYIGDYIWKAPLHIAIQNKDLNIVNLLLDYGANPNFSQSAVDIALKHNLDFALKNDPKSFNAIKTHLSKFVEKQSPLHFALRKRNTEAAEALLKHGAIVDEIDNDRRGETLLHYGVRKVNAFSFLLEHGANPNIANNYGDTPLYYAAIYKREDEYKLLLKYGANPNIANNDGETPLLEAAWNGNHELVKLSIQLEDQNTESSSEITATSNQANADFSISDVLVKATFGFKIVDSVVDGLKLFHEPTLSNARTVIYDSVQLYNLYSEISNPYYIPLSIGSIAHQLYYKEYKQAAITTASMSLSALTVGTFGVGIVPYASASVALYAGCSAFKNLYSFYKNYGTAKYHFESSLAYGKLYDKLGIDSIANLKKLQLLAPEALKEAAHNNECSFTKEAIFDEKITDFVNKAYSYEAMDNILLHISSPNTYCDWLTYVL